MLQSDSDVALEQARLDFPDFNVTCHVLAEETERFLIVASLFKRTGPTVRPNPVVLYAVQKSTKSVARVDDSNGLPHGFNPRLRR